MQVDRRTFLLAAAMPLYAAAPLAVFSAEEAKLVEALCAQIVPADEAPGAKEAGVLYYIDRQLAGPLKRFVPAYKKGLAGFPADFVEMPFARQTEYLRQIESGGDRGMASFFQMTVDHVMQGFYGNPAHGGNRDEASWKMLGITSMMEGHSH